MELAAVNARTYFARSITINASEIRLAACSSSLRVNSLRVDSLWKIRPRLTKGAAQDRWREEYGKAKLGRALPK
ncbi:MAG: hypothetical protein ABL995_05990 [Bryobacteraceae bacterium]